MCLCHTALLFGNQTAEHQKDGRKENTISSIIEKFKQQLFTNIADEIRAKSGQTGEIFACDFVDRIHAL